MENILRYFDDFTPQQLAQFEQLKPLYLEWNEKINVVSRKDIDSLYERHVLHSLSIATLNPFSDGMEVVDLGTGGGFPGIPLAIFYPEVKFHLVDSINKKLTVAAAVAEAIGLSNVTVQHTRVEEIKNRKFDFVVSRAVAPLKDLWRWSKPLLKKPGAPVEGMIGGGLLCLKGGDLALEIQESGTRPRLMNIHEIFGEDFFEGKYLVYVPR
ncbi:MAG: 16S rRNA (guanine(527)-N(7))-methyltransferase RsmG [Chitinophagaceae bacterium]|nr:MAG: 16S rRNA (guanine(527)-N(7))-methyltransferase RsmG [Chitinophagaceae bacterium]